MTWLLGILGGRVFRWIAIAGVVASLGGSVVMWARWDAVRDYRTELRALSAENRLSKIEEDRKRDDEIDGLGVDDLRNLAGEWLRDARD